MRIEKSVFNHHFGNKPQTKMKEKEETFSSPNDAFHFNADAKLLSGLLQKAKTLPDERIEKVEALKQAIENGNYRVTGEEIVSRLKGLVK